MPVFASRHRQTPDTDCRTPRGIPMSDRQGAGPVAVTDGWRPRNAPGRRRCKARTGCSNDFARLMTDAAGAAQGVRREAETVFKAQVERLIRDMDIASREELDVLRDLVSTLRSQNDAHCRPVTALEPSSAPNRRPARARPSDRRVIRAPPKGGALVHRKNGGRSLSCSPGSRAALKRESGTVYSGS